MTDYHAEDSVTAVADAVMLALACGASPMARSIASDDGAQLAILEPSCISIIDTRSLERCAEIAVGGDDETEIAFAGAKLIVLTDSPTHATLHILDTREPGSVRSLGQLLWPAGTRLLATTSHHVLLTAHGSTMLVGLAPVSIAALPLRGAVRAAPLGNDRFIVASDGALEEWDAFARIATRRVQLDRSWDPQFVGGNALRLWTIRRSSPDEIEVISLTRSTPRCYPLPEPVESLHVHARGDLMIAIGNRTGIPFVVDLAQPEPVIRLGVPRVELITWLGRARCLAYAPLGGALTVYPVPRSNDCASVAMTVRPRASHRALAKQRLARGSRSG